MNRQKKFDCVRMKWDIQQKILTEFSDIPEEKAYQVQSEKIAQNPILGPVITKIRLSRKRFKQKSKQSVRSKLLTDFDSEKKATSLPNYVSDGE